jgi:hypothetical protein
MIPLLSETSLLLLSLSFHDLISFIWASSYQSWPFSLYITQLAVVYTEHQLYSWPIVNPPVRCSREQWWTRLIGYPLFLSLCPTALCVCGIVLCIHMCLMLHYTGCMCKVILSCVYNGWLFIVRVFFVHPMYSRCHVWCVLFVWLFVLFSLDQDPETFTSHSTYRHWDWFSFTFSLFFFLLWEGKVERCFGKRIERKHFEWNEEMKQLIGWTGWTWEHVKIVTLARVTAIPASIRTIGHAQVRTTRIIIQVV